MTELICHFGKHQGTPISEISSGYLRWVIANIDPVPLKKYQVDDNGRQLPKVEVKAMEERMRAFIFAAEDELANRDTT